MFGFEAVKTGRWPTGLDYISVDYYTDPTNAPEPNWCRNVNTSSSYLYPVPKRMCVNSEMTIVRQTMRHEVYPKLTITNRTWGPTPAGKQPLYRHQGVLLVPGISSTCTGSGADCDAIEDVIVQKLEQMFIWAKQDWLVGGFMPWHFGRWSRALCVFFMSSKEVAAQTTALAPTRWACRSTCRAYWPS